MYLAPGEAKIVHGLELDGRYKLDALDATHYKLQARPSFDIVTADAPHEFRTIVADVNTVSFSYDVERARSRRRSFDIRSDLRSRAANGNECSDKQMASIKEAGDLANKAIATALA